jgi:hydrogenase/urease accessory protein HupE
MIGGRSTPRRWGRAIRHALAAAGSALAVLAASPAHAHTAGVSTSRIAVNGRAIELEINALGRDYEKAAGVRIAETSGEVNPVALSVMAPAILGYVGEHVAVLAGEARCSPGQASAKAADTHVLITMAWTCPPEGALRYRVTLFQDVDPAARHLAVIASGQGEREFAIDKNAPEIALSSEDGSVLQIVGRFVAAGIEHIFLGYDHIAFLLAVILWGRRLWPLIKVVTAFTVAHSLTLTLAVLDVVRLPSSLVEPLIAATIVYVAAENFFVRDISKRWRATFVLGLVHGFGFAGALREYGLPDRALIPALAAFNIGVEIGQVAIVAVIFPLLLLSDRIGVAAGGKRERHASLVYACSAVILVFGLYWLIERTVFA